MGKKFVTQGGDTWIACKVDGCNDDVLAKGLCQKHYGRARRKKPLGVDPLRGLTATVLIHCEPKLKRWLERTAKRDKVSVSARAAYLLREEMHSLTNGHPF